MKIEKGKEYRCINDVEMHGSGKIEFKLGRTYKCSFDNNLIDESGYDHEVSDDFASKHFELLSDYYLRIHKGREIKGFRFNDFTGTKSEYTSEMNNYFGKKGKIECLNSLGKSFGVRFEDGKMWFYPVDKCIDQLDKKVKIESFPKDPIIQHHNNINKPILIFTFPNASQEFGNDIKSILKEQGVYNNYSVLIKGAMTSDKESVVIINLDGTINKVEF